MKIRKLLCILCAFSMLLALTACDNSASVLQLNGKSCHVGLNAAVSQLPAPYCSLNSEKPVKAGAAGEVSSGLDAIPYYKCWVKNSGEKDCAFQDATLTGFLMIGGKPGDMVYRGVTFGQTKEETEKKLNPYEKSEEFNNSTDEQAIQTVLYKKLGEDWKDQVHIIKYRFDHGYYLRVTYLDEKVYAMALIYDTFMA